MQAPEPPASCPPPAKPWAAVPHANMDHSRFLWVNVSSSFAIVDGEIGLDNIFAVDPESCFDSHMV